MSRLVSIAAAAAIVATAIGAGYVIGSSEAPDRQEAVDAQGTARERSRSAAEERSFDASRAKGRLAGRKAGGDAARSAGSAAGEESGGSDSEDELALATAEQESTATATATDDLPRVPPGSTYTDQLPNNLPGYVLPEDQRSIACVGIDVTGKCVGD